MELNRAFIGEKQKKVLVKHQNLDERHSFSTKNLGN